MKPRPLAFVVFYVYAASDLTRVMDCGMGGQSGDGQAAYRDVRGMQQAGCHLRAAGEGSTRLSRWDCQRCWVRSAGSVAMMRQATGCIREWPRPSAVWIWALVGWTAR
ncbi:hypothetical protein WI665_00705 [Vibrio cholerae]